MIVESIAYHPRKLQAKPKKGFFIEYRLDLYPRLEEAEFSVFNANNILCCKDDALNADLLDKMLSSDALIDLDTKQLDKYSDKVDTSRLILSTHLPAFDETAIRSFLSHPQPAKVYKLVYEAATLQEMIDTAQIIAEQQDRDVIFNVTGKWAYFQRSFFHFFNSIGLYSALEEPLFEGQPTSIYLSRMVDAVYAEDSMVLLVLGSDKVSQSGSVRFGNSVLAKLDLHTAFIPVPARDVSEAMAACKFTAQRARLLGMAITSPFKHIMADFFRTGKDAINTIQFNSQKHLKNYYCPELDAFVYPANTDLICLQEAKQGLNIHKKHSILIYGSGDCATAFTKKLLQSGYKDIQIEGRNKQTVENLRQSFGIEDNPKAEYDLLINASGLGQDKNDDLSVLPSFKALVNLPLPQPVSLLEDYAQEHEIPLFSSTAFWSHQFSHQIKCFLYQKSTNPIDTFE